MPARRRSLSGHSFKVRLFLTLAGIPADLPASADLFPGAEAGIDPARSPAVRAWLDRIRTLPGWVAQYTLMAR
jgi:hypothetical protein